MQYTSSSFAEMLVGMFRVGPAAQRPSHGLAACSPRTASSHSHVPDTVLDRVLVPGSRRDRARLPWLRWIQRGSVHAYLLYILATLVWLLVWQGGR